MQKWTPCLADVFLIEYVFERKELARILDEDWFVTSTYLKRTFLSPLHEDEVYEFQARHQCERVRQSFISFHLFQRCDMSFAIATEMQSLAVNKLNLWTSSKSISIGLN